ncbi:MAG: hypothetical protein V7707_03890 [Motiliproteus sp.]
MSSIKLPPSLENVEWLRHDDLFLLNDSSIKHLRKKAKNLQQDCAKSKQKIKLFDAQNFIAHKFGFESWRHVANTLNYENKETNLLGYTEHPDGRTLKDSYTLRQIHGAAYRFLNKKPEKNIIQFCLDDKDVSEWCDSSLFNKLGIIEDLHLQQWLMDFDPFFAYNDGDSIAESMYFYRLIGLDTTDHNEVTEHFWNLSDSFSMSRPTWIWINGALPPETTPPDACYGFDDCPLLQTSPEAYPRIYQ